MFIECLLYARSYCRHWRCSSEWGGRNPWLCGAYILVGGDTHRNKMNVHFWWCCSDGQPGQQQSSLWHLLLTPKASPTDRHKQFSTDGQQSLQVALFSRILPAHQCSKGTLLHINTVPLSLLLSCFLSLFFASVFYRAPWKITVSNLVSRTCDEVTENGGKENTA